MTAINSLSSSNYYQLSGKQSSSAEATSISELLNQLTAQSNSVSEDGDVVDFSQSAQNYLNSISSSSSKSTQNSGFILSTDQQAKLSSILAKYEGAPFTQETYNKLQDDLQAAGLSPAQLSAQDKVKSFNPTKILLDILSGTQTDVQSFGSDDTTEQANADNYMKQILEQLKVVTRGSAESASNK